jgi:hypothetical protein
VASTTTAGFTNFMIPSIIRNRAGKALMICPAHNPNFSYLKLRDQEFPIESR